MGALTRRRGGTSTPARGRGTGMVMGHAAAPATLLEPASAGSEVAISVPDSVLGKAVLKIRV